MGKINNDEWFIWEQNACPLFLVATASMFEPLRDYMGSCFFNGIIIFEMNKDGNYHGKWLFRLDEGRALGQKMVDMLICPQYNAVFKKQFEIAKKELLDNVEVIRALNQLEKIATKDILELFNELYSKYTNFYTLGYFTEPIRWQTEHILNKFVHEQFPEKPEKILKILLSVEHDPFVFVVMQDLMSIKNKFANELKTKKYSVNLMNACEIHANQFYFKNNNYYETVKITKESVLKELHHLPKQISARDDLQEEKQRLLEKLPPYFQSIARLVNYSSELGHVRKQVVNRVNAAFDKLLGEIAKRTGVTMQEIRLLLAEELAYFVENPSRYKERFKLRKQKFLIMRTDFPLNDELIDIPQSCHCEEPRAERRGRGNPYPNENALKNWKLKPMSFPFIAEGEQAVEKTLEALNPRLNLFHYDLNKYVQSNLKGNVIFAPAQTTIRGKVRIVTDPRKEILQPGEILVACSTTPDYVAALHDCIAIITDWGGSTSHAAVIARELKKPCVVGTNFATHFLHTGDIVEIDFKTGEIKKAT